MGLARDLCTRYLLLELQLFVAQHLPISVYHLPNETHQIRSRIRRSLSHALLPFQSEFFAKLRKFVIFLWEPHKSNSFFNIWRLQVSRLQFKRLVSPEFATIMSLHAGEAYAMQNLTRTDRLGLLLTGKVNVLSDTNFLHPILPCEFLDSPEFESSRPSVDDKFKVQRLLVHLMYPTRRKYMWILNLLILQVSIIAASSCRYLYWQRSALEYLLVKETYLATVLTTLVARDIATKLYAMNNKVVLLFGRELNSETD